jgi:hypothetical protein
MLYVKTAMSLAMVVAVGSIAINSALAMNSEMNGNSPTAPDFAPNHIP